MIKDSFSITVKFVGPYAKQREQVIIALAKAIHNFPRLRIGQILGNLPFDDLFYIEDNMFEAAILNYIQENKE